MGFDHIWHQPIMQAADANEINGRCHGDLMLHGDGSLSTWLHLRYGRCQAEGAIARVGNMRVRGREMNSYYIPQCIASP